MAGDDHLLGFDGDDALYGDEGNDRFYGGTGDDTMYADEGCDIMSGQGGRDTATYAASTAGVEIDLIADIFSGGFATGDSIYATEDLIGSAFDDRLRGTMADNALSGGDGNDWLSGARGMDRIDGGLDDDEILGCGGADMLDGGDGVDTASYLTSTAAVQINLFADAAAGGHAEGDMLDNFENLFGSRYSDTLTGDAGANALNGHSRHDRLDGGLGNDSLTGGVGSDTFVFSTVDFGQDVITDFQNGRDKLDFTAIGLGFADFTEAQVGADVVLTYTADPGQTVTLLETDARWIDAFDFV